MASSFGERSSTKTDLKRLLTSGGKLSILILICPRCICPWHDHATLTCLSCAHVWRKAEKCAVSDHYTWESICVITLGFSCLLAELLGLFLLSLYAFSGFYLTSKSNNLLMGKVYK